MPKSWDTAAWLVTTQQMVVPPVRKPFIIADVEAWDRVGAKGAKGALDNAAGPTVFHPVHPSGANPALLVSKLVFGAMAGHWIHLSSIPYVSPNDLETCIPLSPGAYVIGKGKPTPTGYVVHWVPRPPADAVPDWNNARRYTDGEDGAYAWVYYRDGVNGEIFIEVERHREAEVMAALIDGRELEWVRA